MPIVQISRIQHRRGKKTDLPQLAAGELGWSIDDQRLYIGNGTVADGAPAIGNTEILLDMFTEDILAVPVLLLSLEHLATSQGLYNRRLMIMYQ